MTYNAVKAAEISLAKALAQQLAGDNIRVNSVAPGSISFPRRLLAPPPAGGSGGGWPRSCATTCRSARFGRAEEVGDVVAFLASPRGELDQRRVDHGRRLPVAVAVLAAAGYCSSSNATPRASKAAVSSRPAFTAAGQPA